MAAPVSTLSIAQIKSELMDLNDSSFVFTNRGELECALRNARKMAGVREAAGLKGGAALSASDTTRTLSATSASETERMSSALSELSIAEEGTEVDATPDMVSVSSASASGATASRGSSHSRSGVNNPPTIVEKPSSDSSKSGGSGGEKGSPNGKKPAKKVPAPQAGKDIFSDEQPQEHAASRRLVEYFVMVSSVPLDDSELTEKANKRVHTRSRPPDPTRDDMNSRTKARFDVRRVHLNHSAGNGNDGKGKDTDANEEIASTLLEPTITARYPKEDHPDQPLNLRLPQFCHPEGTELIRPTAEYKMPRVHHFVLTDSMGGKLYGTALTVMEEFGGEDEEGGKKKGKTYYAPRVLCLLSTYPYLTAFRTYLTQLYRLATATDCMAAPIERYVLNICSEVPAPPPGAFEVQLDILGNDIRFWAPPADQPVAYVSLPFSVLFECLDIGNILFAWYTLACERKVLLVSSQLSLLTVCSEILCSLLFPMRWSHLYIPVLPRSLCPMLDAPMPYLCGISRENFPYAVEDISDETVVVDLDRNVITLGPNTADLPPLPQNRRKKLEAALKANAGEVFWEARNLAKADVLRVRASGDERTLGTMLDKAGAVWEERVQTRDEAFSLAHTPDSVSMEFDEDANVYDKEPKQSRWDAVQEAFLRFYVSLLQDYRKFLPADAKSMEKRSTWRGKEGMSRLRFGKDEFVLAAPSEFQPFLEELAITQQFDDFVTRKMHNADDAPDIKFFDQSIDAKKNRSKLRMKKKETPFLVSASAHRDLKQVKAVAPNAEGLPETKRKYLYETWPVGFDESLFGTPRPIPSIISAEFDRRTALRSMLRSKYGIVDDTRGGRNRSPEATAFVLFFATFTSVIGKEMALVERKHGVGPDDESSGPGIARQGSKRQSLTDLGDDMEVARTIAKGQIDLGYHTLSLMRLRKLPPEPIIYKLLIQACGRCQVTHRASGLMEMLARDGLATNSEIYTSLISAFSSDEGQPSSLALYQVQGDDNMSSLSFSQHGSNPASPLLSSKRRSTVTVSTPSEHSLDLISEVSPSESGSVAKSRKDKFKAKLSFNTKKNRRKLSSPGISKKQQKLRLTAAVSKHIDLGESILDAMYPNIKIDTDNVCPKCAAELKEDDICQGWTACASIEYETECRSCRHRFVPKFIISCNSESFEGSQGKGTPLYCDHLSPWVLLREIRSVISATGGVDSILDEKFRHGPDITSTLWWNMIVTFRRYQLPFIFLLQGSFSNQLIMPTVDD
ncbi:hypothetical protein ACHAXT_011115 [Thalassiosira profunda]